MAYAETIERLLERKLSTFEKMCESINHNIASLNENFNKNYEEVASIKVCLFMPLTKINSKLLLYV